MKISVCIPTYQRANLLQNAAKSLEAQSRKPNEIIIVWRDGDVETGQVIRMLQQRSVIKITPLLISAPGFLPPIRAAIDCAQSDVLAFMDDDAEAFPDWLCRMESHYTDDRVGGVGGRIITVFDGVVANFPPAKVVGKLNYFGKSFGNMYRESITPEVRDVDFIAGGNMSYRTPILKKVGVDLNLGNDVAMHWEMDLGLSVKRSGYKIHYDPDMKVYHYTGPREKAGMRRPNSDGVYWHNFNYAYIMAKHLPFHRLVLFVGYRLIIGSTDSPGLLNFVANLLTLNKTEWVKCAPSALAGWISGLIFYIRLDRVHRF
jgi:GT2 family glycosyltransferase